MATHCSVAFSMAEVVDQTTGKKTLLSTPTFVSIHQDDTVDKLVDESDELLIEVKPRDRWLAQLELSIRAHHDCDCDEDPIEERLVAIDTSQKIEDFITMVHKNKYFIWHVSTPSFDAKIVVDTTTGDIIGKSILDRLVN